MSNCLREHIPEANIAVVGTSQTGKTAFILRYLIDQFHGTDNGAIAVKIQKILFQWRKKFCHGKGLKGGGFYHKLALVNEKKVRLGIWDTNGKEESRQELPKIFERMHAVMICFSLCDRFSFKEAEYYVKLAQKECPADPYMMLIGTNYDRWKSRAVTYDEAESFAMSNGLSYFETSAKDDINVDEAFQLVSEEMAKKFYGKEEAPEPEKTNVECSIF